MVSRLFAALANLFRRRGVLVPDVTTLNEGEARKVDVGDVHAGGTRVILCKVDGEVHALDSRCPHDGGEITTGPLVEGKYALCPLHRYRFDPKTGLPVCDNKYPPGTVIGDYQSSSSPIADRVPR